MSISGEARILIVDDQREVARVLRTALELANNDYHVTDVPSAEEAMLELGRKFDLIVTDYRLPGMPGPDLLKRLKNVSSETKAIMITGSPMDEVKPAIEGLDVYRLFEKPIDTEAFVEAVNHAIHGEPDTTGLKIPVTNIGPLAEFDQDAIDKAMEKLMIDLGSQGMAFISRSGKVHIKKGNVDDVPRFGELVILLASNFSTTTEIATYLSDGSSSALHYYDGEYYDIFALSTGRDYFITMIYPGGSSRQMGVVLRYGKQGAQDIKELIDDQSEDKPKAKAVKPTEDDNPEEIPARPEMIERVHDPAAEAAAEDTSDESDADDGTSELDDDLMALFGEGDVEAIELDLSDLDGDPELDDMGDLDSFWDEAGAIETKVSDDALTAEEARELGLLPDSDLED